MLGKPPAGNEEASAESSSLQPFQYKVRPEPETHTLLHRRVTWNERAVTTYVKDLVSGKFEKKVWKPYTFKTIEDRDASNFLYNLDLLTDPNAVPHSKRLPPAESATVPFISQDTKHLQVKLSDLGKTPEESQWEDKLGEIALEDLSEEETNLQAKTEDQQQMFDNIKFQDRRPQRNFDIGDELSKIQEAVRKEFDARNKVAAKATVLGKGSKTTKLGHSLMQNERSAVDLRTEEEEIQKEVKVRIMAQLNEFLKRTLNV